MKYFDYNIRPAKEMPTLYEITFDGKGRVANALTGFFTSTGSAKEAIDRYLKLGSHAKTNAQS